MAFHKVNSVKCWTPPSGMFIVDYLSSEVADFLHTGLYKHPQKMFLQNYFTKSLLVYLLTNAQELSKETAEPAHVVFPQISR